MADDPNARKRRLGAIDRGRVHFICDRNDQLSIDKWIEAEEYSMGALWEGFDEQTRISLAHHFLALDSNRAPQRMHEVRS
jgi:hypothetical protein